MTSSKIVFVLSPSVDVHAEHAEKYVWIKIIIAFKVFM